MVNNNVIDSEEGEEYSGEVISRSEPVFRERTYLIVENVYTELPGVRQNEGVHREEGATHEAISCFVAENPHVDMEETESSDMMGGPMFGYGLEENLLSEQVCQQC